MTIDKGNSAIEFRLDPDSGVPTYLQLVQQVEHALRLGYLKPGDQLPKVRDVVATLTINPNTVLKAYRELEHKLASADAAGLDEDGIVALFTSGLRDFFKTSGGKRGGGVTGRARAVGVTDRVGAAEDGTEGVA